jgi:hypothetical protein
MSVDIRKQRKQAITKADEELLAELGYKQEFRRAFKPIEVSYRPCFPIACLPTLSLLCLGFRNCVQHRWSPAFHRVSPGSPPTRAS